MTDKHDDVFTMKLDELERRVTRAAALLAEAEALLPGLAQLDAASRRYSMGRLRAGEDEALLAIFDAAEAHPASFQALVSKDGPVIMGSPAAAPRAVFETVPARAALARRDLLGKVGRPSARLAERLRDSETVLGARAKEVGIAAHAIGRVNARDDEALRAAMATATEFYAAAAPKKK